MDKDLISKYLSIISLGALLLFACGTYITNSFLRSYHMMDFNLLKPQAIITGFTFITVIILHLMVFMWFMNINKLGNNNILRVIVVTTLKVGYLSVFLFLIFGKSKLVFEPLFEPSLFGLKLGSEIVKGSIVFFMMFPMFMIFYYANRKTGKRDVLDYMGIIFIVVGIVASIIVFFCLYPNPDFRKIMGFEILVGVNFVLMVAFSPNDNDKEPRKYSGVFFSFGEKSKFQSHLLSIIIIFCYVPGFIVVMEQYTTIIYPNIDQSFGGGKLEQMTYITGSDTISGNKVYETENYIFLENPDSTITKIDWADVTKVIHK